MDSTSALGCINAKHPLDSGGALLGMFCFHFCPQCLLENLAQIKTPFQIIEQVNVETRNRRHTPTCVAPMSGKDSTKYHHGEANIYRARRKQPSVQILPTFGRSSRSSPSTPSQRRSLARCLTWRSGQHILSILSTFPPAAIRTSLQPVERSLPSVRHRRTARRNSPRRSWHRVQWHVSSASHRLRLVDVLRCGPSTAFGVLRKARKDVRGVLGRDGGRRRLGPGAERAQRTAHVLGVPLGEELRAVRHRRLRQLHVLGHGRRHREGVRLHLGQLRRHHFRRGSENKLVRQVDASDRSQTRMLRHASGRRTADRNTRNDAGSRDTNAMKRTKAKIRDEDSWVARKGRRPFLLEARDV